MSLAVIAIPDLLPDDAELLHEMQSRNGVRSFGLIHPFLTVVEPTDELDASPLIEHVRSIAGSLGSFTFALRCALPFFDRENGRTQVVLVPERGFSDLVRVRSMLYRGALREALRLDVPFIPHLSVGEFDDPERAWRMADRLNEDRPAVLGSLRELAVVELDGESVQTLARIPLGSGSGVPSTRLH